MKKMLLIAAALSLIGFHARADVLVSFTFDGSVRSSFDTDPNSTPSDLADGAGWTSAIDSGRGNAAPSISVSADQTGTSQTNSIAGNDYYSFTITPAGGFSMSFTSLSFDYSNYTNAGPFVAENFFVRSSVDGFAANLAPAVSVDAANAGAFQHTDISLSGASFQALPGAVEFRIYIYDGSTSADKGALLDNIVLNGVTAIPEPATYMLFGLGLLACAQRFRRSKNK